MLKHNSLVFRYIFYVSELITLAFWTLVDIDETTVKIQWTKFEVVIKLKLK